MAITTTISDKAGERGVTMNSAQKLLVLLGTKAYHYYLRDLFSGTIAAGSVNGTYATDGMHIRSIVDTENKISIGSDSIIFAGGKASAALGDPMLSYTQPFNRIPGLTLDIEFMATITNQGTFGLHSSQDASWNITEGFRILSGKFYDAVSTTDLATTHYSNGHKLARVVLKAVGYNLYTSDDGGLSWLLEHENTTSTTNPLYLVFQSYNFTGSFRKLSLFTGIKPLPNYIYDDFDRADTIANAGSEFELGSLGQTDQGIKWTASGAALPFISSESMVINAEGGAGYGILAFPTNINPKTLTGKIEWNTTSGVGDEGLGVLISGTALLTDMVHCIFYLDHYVVTIWDNADLGTHIQLGENIFAACAVDTEYTIGMRVDGNTVYITCPDGQIFSHTNAAVSTHWGRNVCFELVHNIGYNEQPKFNNVRVDW